MQKYYGKINNKNFQELFIKSITLKEFPKIQFFSMNEISQYTENKLLDLFFYNSKIDELQDPKNNFNFNKIGQQNNFDINNLNKKKQIGNYLVSKIDFIEYPSWIKFFIMVIKINCLFFFLFKIFYSLFKHYPLV
jgi:hypothetical protein